jgi:hypothetical protein
MNIGNLLLWLLGGVLARSGSVVLQPLGMCIIMGNAILTVRDHYLPEEYWKYVSYHPGPFYGYEVRYVGEDHCIHYIEIPKNSDGSLRWEDARYIRLLYYIAVILSSFTFQ